MALGSRLLPPQTGRGLLWWRIWGFSLDLQWCSRQCSTGPGARRIEPQQVGQSQHMESPCAGGAGRAIYATRRRGYAGELPSGNFTRTRYSWLRVCGRVCILSCRAVGPHRISWTEQNSTLSGKEFSPCSDCETGHFPGRAVYRGGGGTGDGVIAGDVLVTSVISPAGRGEFREVVMAHPKWPSAASTRYFFCKRKMEGAVEKSPAMRELRKARLGTLRAYNPRQRD